MFCRTAWAFGPERWASGTVEPSERTPACAARKPSRAQNFGNDRHRWSLTVSKRTFQPNNRRRAKTHGFRLRMRTRAGRAIITARRRKGREKLSA